MTAVATLPPTYDRQISTESGWDNPFRPGGDLSREADEIVNLIKGGKPITPNGDYADQTLLNGDTPKESKDAQEVTDGATKLESSPLQATQQKNGTKVASPIKNQNGASQPETQLIPGPQSASHVIIDEKKKKNCRCCVIQ